MADDAGIVTTRTVRPIDVVWTATAVAIPVIAALWAGLGTIDLAYHLRLGEQILDSGSIPTTDTFTFTMFGTEWVDQQWGAQVVLAIVDRLGGWSALVLFRAVLVGVSFFLVGLVCRIRGASAATAALLTLASFAMAASSLALRPQLLALPLVCLAVWLLVTADRGCRRLVLLPPITWVCATFHGAFLVLLTVLAVATAVAWIRRSPDRVLVLTASAVSVVLTFLTPLGTDLWSSALQSASDPMLRDLITEWQRTTLDTPEGWMLAASVLGLGIVVARSPRTWPQVLMLLPFLALAVAARRGVLWWAILVPVVAASFLPQRTRRDAGRESWAPAIALIGVLAVVIVAVTPFRRVDDLLLDAPAGLARAVADQLPDGSHLVAHQSWASWLELEAPGALQYVDSRFLLTDGMLEDYAAIVGGGAGWRDVADRWQVDAIAGAPDWPVLTDLRRDDGWSIVHEDDESFLAVRRT